MLTRYTAVRVNEMLHQRLRPVELLYTLACHLAAVCVVAAVLLLGSRCLTRWLSHCCFPLIHCKMLSLPPVLPSSPPSSIPLSPPFPAGLQMSGFPKVSSLPLCDCPLPLLL